MLPRRFPPDPGGMFPHRLFPRSYVVSRMADAAPPAGMSSRGTTTRNWCATRFRSALKAMESLLASSPEHKGLLTALCKGFTQYGRRLRPPGRRGGAGSRDAQGGDGARPQAPAPREGVRSARAVGGAGWIRGQLSGTLPGRRRGSGPRMSPAVLDGRLVEPRGGVVGRSGAAGGSPRCEALMRRALALDERYDDGAVHEYFVASRGAPRGDGGSVDRAGIIWIRRCCSPAGGGLRRWSPSPRRCRSGPGPEGVPGPLDRALRLRRAVGRAGTPDGQSRVPAPGALAEREGG